MKVTVKDAAKKLDMPEQSLRLWLQNGNCPFGSAFKGRGKAYQYYIHEDRLNAWISGTDLKSAPDLAGQERS